LFLLARVCWDALMDITDDFKYIVVGIFCVWTWVCLPMGARATCAGDIIKSFAPYRIFIVSLSCTVYGSWSWRSMNSPTAVTFC